MKLFSSPTSPYARKVRALIIEKQLEGQVEIIQTAPSELPQDLLAANPLARIPTLLMDDGTPLIDSPVICEYLDSLGDKAGERSGTGKDVWTVKHLHAYADGIIDTAFTISMERRRDESEQSPSYIQGQVKRIERGVEALNTQAKTLSAVPNLGEIAVACCLGYLDLRIGNDYDWRANNPDLAAWYADVAKRPSIARTQPPQ